VGSYLTRRSRTVAVFRASAAGGELDAIAPATLDTLVVLDEIEEARDRGIPIIGFDSGVYYNSQNMNDEGVSNLLYD